MQFFNCLFLICPVVVRPFRFSIFGSVVWPCVPVLVEPKMQGTAYGIMTSFQNAGQFIVPLVLQQVYRHAHSYTPCQGFFIVSSLLGVIIAVVMWVVDETMNHSTLRLPEEPMVIHPALSSKHNSAHDGFGLISRLSGLLLAEKSGSARYYGSLERELPRAASSDKIKIAVPTLPLHQLPVPSSNSSLSSNGIGSFEMVSEHMKKAAEQNNRDNADSPLLGANKFSRLRAFTMPESRPSVCKDLSSLASHESRNNSVATNSTAGIRSYHSDSDSPSAPIAVIALPNVVRKSQEFYERANSLQFPREDPHVLRRIISEQNRQRSAASQWLGVAGGSAQSAPVYPNSQAQMDDYQRYRQQLIHEHNTKSQLQQQEQLVLASSPRRSPRLL